MQVVRSVSESKLGRWQRKSELVKGLVLNTHFRDKVSYQQLQMVRELRDLRN